MVIFEFLHNHFKSICALISALGTIFGICKREKPTIFKSSKKVNTNIKIGKLDKSFNKQNKPTFNFSLFNITNNFF